MRIVDWRNVAHHLVEPLIAGEVERWRRDLMWDAAGLWQAIVEGRRAGHVSGFVAVDDRGVPAGWTTFGLHRGILQVAALDGTSGEAVRALLDAIVTSPEARFAERYHGFVLSSHRRQTAALERRRFAVERFRYLVKPFADRDAEDGAGPALAPSLRAVNWSDESAPDVVRLLSRAYEGVPTARAFAPRARLDEWTAYVGQLLLTSGCGTLVPDASIEARDGDGRLAGVLITTRLADATWHVAQVAVEPGHQRSGVGRWMVVEACRRARECGMARMTLLVSERNTAARRLYATLGFDETQAAFLFASRERVTRVAARATCA
ncbi:MAG: GNAT family N-acetyltransferase [Vicinamibacteraceae bacterium]|nr:GNAT family N-acetyltransferase [Vicinamibacteraceae bacterium]